MNLLKKSKKRKLSKKEFQEKNKFFSDIFLILTLVCIFVSTVLFAVSVFLIMTAWHNIDLTHNYQRIAFDVNPFLLDHNLTMSPVYEVMDAGTAGILPLSDYYSFGHNQLMTSIRCSLSALVLMFYAVILSIIRYNLLENMTNLKLKDGK